MKTLNQNFLCKETPSFSSQLMIYSINKITYSDFFETILLVVEYLQLLSQLLLIRFNLYPDSTSNSNQVTDFIHSLARGFDLAYIVDYESDKSIALMLVVIAAILTLLKFLLFLYIIWTIAKKNKGKQTLVDIWKLISYTQGRVLYFYIIAFWIGFFISKEDSLFSINEKLYYSLKTVFWALIVFEYLTSMLITRYLRCILPRENLLSSKSNTLILITLTQKFISQILSAFSFEYKINFWIYPILGLLFDALRVYNFLQTLPFYKTKALFLQAGLLMLTVAFNISSFVQSAMKGLHYSTADMNFLIILWIILTVVAIKAMITNLRNFLTEIITTRKPYQIEILSHKVFLLEELEAKSEGITKHTIKRGWKSLAFKSLSSNLSSMFKSEESLFNSSDSPLILHYLEKLSSDLPKNDILKLHIAYFYGIKLEKYVTAIRILTELQNKPDFIIRSNASLLIEDMQGMLTTWHKHNQSVIDLYAYNRNTGFVTKLKQSMLRQAKLQNSIYDAIHQDSPNLAKIINKAQEISIFRSQIDKEIQARHEVLPEYYLEPVMLCAYYHLILNHRTSEYLTCIKKFTERSRKYGKFFRANVLCEENFYHKDVGIFCISGQKENIGAITWTSKRFVEIYGTDGVGQEMHHVTIPFLQSCYKRMFRSQIESGTILTSDIINLVFAYNNKTGYMIPISYYLNMYPSMLKGLHYISIVRPILEPKEYLILSEDGRICGFTEGIARKLELPSLTEANSGVGTHIEHICPEFSKINRAFNMIAFLDKKEVNKDSPKNTKLDLETAKQLYEQYSTNGEIIQLAPLRLDNSPSRAKNRQVHKFHCTMTNRFFENIVAKIITGQEIRQENMTKNSTAEELEPVKIESQEDDIPSERESPLKIKLPSPLNGTKQVSFSPRDTQTYPQATQSPTTFRTGTFDTEIMLASTRRPLAHKLATTENVINISPKKKNNNSDIINIINSDSKQEKNLKFNVDNTSVGSQKTNSSSPLRKLKAFNESLSSKYYSHRYTVFILLLCGLFLGVIVNQALVKVGMSKYITRLKARKDVLTRARVRSLTMINMHRNLRFLWMFGTGMQNESDIITTNGKIAGTVTRLETYVDDLITDNRELRNEFDLIQDDLRELVFQKNVRMFQTSYNDAVQVYMNANTFDAGDQIIADSLRIIQETNSGNLDSQTTIIDIMIRNILNDILLQDDNMADLFLDSLDYYRDSNLSSILVAYIIVIVLLIALLFVFGQGVYQQYISEKINMTAVAGFHVKEVAYIQGKLLNFIRRIEEETSFEDAPLLDIHKFYYDQKTFEHKSQRKMIKDDTKFASSRAGIRKKYLIYMVKLIILMACSIGLIVLYTTLARHWTMILNTKIHQLQLTNALNEKLVLSASIMLDMVTETDALILNTPALALLPIDLQNISTTKDLILDFYSSSSESESKVLKPLLFEDQCSQITLSLQSFCVNMTAGQNMIGFIQLTTGMEASLMDLAIQFNESNKSGSELTAFRLEVQNVVLPSIATLQDLGILVLMAVESDLENEIASAVKLNAIVTGIVCTLLVVICWLIYAVVMSKVREADNQFRRVLQVFPTNMILSNFILKTYVIKTASGALNFIKGEL